MGLRKKKSNNKEMKLFATLAALVSANWNGVSEDNSCGMQISGQSMVNSTCTISGNSIAYQFAGNGAFITGANTFTGFDGASVTSIWLFSSNKTAHPVNATTQPAGMPPSAV